MVSVFIAARARVDAAPIATVAGPNSASLRVIVMGTSLSRETLLKAWRADERMSSGKEAPGVLRGVSTIYQFRALFDARNVSTNLDPIEIVHRLVGCSIVCSWRCSGGEWDRSARARLCRLSDAGVTSLSTHRGGRRPKSAKALSNATKPRSDPGWTVTVSTRNIFGACCARATSGHAAAEPRDEIPRDWQGCIKLPVSPPRDNSIFDHPLIKLSRAS